MRKANTRKWFFIFSFFLEDETVLNTTYKNYLKHYDLSIQINNILLNKLLHVYKFQTKSECKHTNCLTKKAGGLNFFKMNIIK